MFISSVVPVPLSTLQFGAEKKKLVRVFMDSAAIWSLSKQFEAGGAEQKIREYCHIKNRLSFLFCSVSEFSRECGTIEVVVVQQRRSP